MVGLTAAAFLTFIYIVPGVIASARKARRAGWIWLIDLLLGWTGIAWLIALFWGAFGAVKAHQGHNAVAWNTQTVKAS